ncbi:MAG: 16S rRNA (uracil(1498)-N(3))-methyltransferase [Sphingomonadales bacterium]|jgi:16S rRNA (uracil1498-N3)-methyltransferase|nr:16S rRNA (uracil(1498)-N(3))-methyltransferase [Sphingomonadales bacterium]MBK9587936.1 16S rRNA (uracil(1498)-N(3))-methyltransferase [Sphingomonadales bacterium]MBL0001282.1 16S rRNA (uracil(1498)-N(3))-methyltransferase [Sphingomonadales bacterium]MBL0114589.1 16S rRNA (uracil(1498)-N(3))-methyltransferase [Sphingomonadales bacterium]
MPATPAWPPQSTPRLFVESPLADSIELSVSGPQAHYLISVMRMKIGSPIKLFDSISGEWLAEVAIIGKRDLILRVTGQLRAREAVPDIWLLAAPIKKARIDLVAEKACELGVARYQPVITRRTVIERLNMDRLRSHMVEAAEQCGRTMLPDMAEPIKLAALLRAWPTDRILYFADESGGEPFANAAAARQGPAAILIGPEGGFDDEERTAIRAHPQSVPISLGPRILRAETAAIAALSIWMASAGDWR